MIDQLSIPDAPKDINVLALTPAEMVPAQHALIAWCGRKIQSLQDEADELDLHHRLAVENGWKTSVVTAAQNRTARRIAYYQKMKLALEAGYLLVPNMPVDVLAVRVNSNAPRRQVDTGWHRFRSSPEQLAAGVGRYVNETPLERERVVERTDHQGKPVRLTEYSSAEHDDDVDFPIALTKPQVLDAVGRAMALKVFDQIGRVRNDGGRDPIYVGQLIDPRGNRRVATFFLAWWVDTATL